MFKVNNKEARATSTLSLFLTLSLTLRILVSLLLTLNIFHILLNVKNAEYVLYNGIHTLCCKRNRLQTEVFFIPNISPPLHSHPNIGPSNFSFFLIYAQGVFTGFHVII